MRFRFRDIQQGLQLREQTWALGKGKPQHLYQQRHGSAAQGLFNFGLGFTSRLAGRNLLL